MPISHRQAGGFAVFRDGKQEIHSMKLHLQRPPRRESAPDDLIVACCPGRAVSLDDKILARIHDLLFSNVEEPRPSNLFLDCRNVHYMNARALGMLVHLHKTLLAKGRRLALVNLCPHVREVFQVTALDKVLDVRTAEYEAQATASSGFPSKPNRFLVLDDEAALSWIEISSNGV
jgi:anti-anti-sigma factor